MYSPEDLANLKQEDLWAHPTFCDNGTHKSNVYHVQYCEQLITPIGTIIETQSPKKKKKENKKNFNSIGKE